MAKSKEQQAAELIASSTALLDDLKATATKTPNRSRPKTPSKAKGTTKAAANQPVQFETAPAINAELVHAPVSGAGINAGVRGDIAQTNPQVMAQSLVAIQEQQNTVLISQANKKLDKEVSSLN